GDARRAPRAPRNFVGAIRCDADAQHARATIDDLLEFFLGIEIEPHRNSESIAQRIRQQPRAGGGADQRERGQVNLHRTRRGTLADDQVELEILHRRIEDLLYGRIEPVDLVDEQNIARLEIGEQRREIPRLCDHRTRGGAEVDAQLTRNDLRQRRLAETRWADKKHMVKRFLAGARRFDEHAQVRARLLLPDEFRQALRPQRRIDVVIALVGSNKAAGVVHLASSLRPCRISVAVSAPSPTWRAAAAMAAAACGWP